MWRLMRNLKFEPATAAIGDEEKAEVLAKPFESVHRMPKAELSHTEIIEKTVEEPPPNQSEKLLTRPVVVRSILLKLPSMKPPGYDGIKNIIINSCVDANY